MAIDNREWGPFYWARVPVERRLFRPAIGDITEVCDPWRRGKAVVLCTGFYKAVAVGLWTRSIHKDIAFDFGEGLPDWLSHFDYDDDTYGDPANPKFIKPLKREDIEAEARSRSRHPSQPQQRGPEETGEEVL
jgi:hypothetical protein